MSDHNSNLVNLTGSRALQTDASGNPGSSAVSSTELGYLSGVTSSLQTQLNSKASSTEPLSLHLNGDNAMTASILFSPDGTGSIGASGATRPNNLFLKSGLVFDTVSQAKQGNNTTGYTFQGGHKDGFYSPADGDMRIQVSGNDTLNFADPGMFCYKQFYQYEGYGFGTPAYTFRNHADAGIGYDSGTNAVFVGNGGTKWFWSSGGNYLAFNDGGVNIGATGANRPLNVFLAGDLSLEVAGKGLKVKSGSNARIGTSVLVAGTVTVANTSVTANSRIFITSQADGGVPGAARVNNIVPGASFDIVSSLVTDTSTVAWFIVEST